MNNSKSNFFLVNDSKYFGNRRWSWNVWLEGPLIELDKVQSVQYFLHPTFSNPIVTITDKSSNFMLSGSGWGEFNIKGEVKMKSGRIFLLNHWLTFDADEKKRLYENSRGYVYLSHSKTDGPLANILAAMLISKDYEVTASAMSNLLDIEEQISESIDSADLNVILVSPGMTEFIETYIAQNMTSKPESKRNKVLFALLGPVDIETDGPLFKTVRIDSKKELDQIVESVDDLLST